jgi:hypothetical protein
MLKKDKRRGQVGIEFLIIAGIILFLFIVIIVFSGERKIEIERTRVMLDSVSECEKISNFITRAYISEEGIQIKTNTNYLIDINNSNIDIKNKKTGKTESSCTFYGKSASYQVTGNFTIKNEKGIVIFTNSTI